MTNYDILKEYEAHKLPVPSYEEYKQLKELMKECRYKIIADLDNARLCESSVDIEDFEYLLNRIDNAIGKNNAGQI